MATRNYYNGIFGQQHINLVRDLLHIVSLENYLATHNPEIDIHAHRNLFQVFVIEQGQVELIANNDYFQINQPTIITIPQNVFHGFTFENGVKGWLLSLSAFAIESMLKFDVEVIYELDTISITPINQKNKLVEDAYTTIHKCIFEYQSHLPGKNLAVQFLVGMLLLRLYRMTSASQTVIPTLDKNERNLFRKFKKAVQQNNSFKTKVEDYAFEVGIPISALHKICKSISGKSPKELIIDFLIQNIKTTLKNKELSIAEVAFIYQLDDPSYFSRIFKLKTGMTPSQFRKKYC